MVSLWTKIDKSCSRLFLPINKKAGSGLFWCCLRLYFCGVTKNLDFRWKKWRNHIPAHILCNCNLDLPGGVGGGGVGGRTTGGGSGTGVGSFTGVRTFFCTFIFSFFGGLLGLPGFFLGISMGGGVGVLGGGGVGSMGGGGVGVGVGTVSK